MFYPTLTDKQIETGGGTVLKFQNGTHNIFEAQNITCKKLPNFRNSLTINLQKYHLQNWLYSSLAAIHAIGLTILMSLFLGGQNIFRSMKNQLVQ